MYTQINHVVKEKQTLSLVITTPRKKIERSSNQGKHCKVKQTSIHFQFIFSEAIIHFSHYFKLKKLIFFKHCLKIISTHCSFSNSEFCIGVISGGTV
jgi:hypothetical protein